MHTGKGVHVTEIGSGTVPLEELEQELRDVVVTELTRRGLDAPESLAAAIDVAPITARALLRRRSWPLEQVTRVARTLDLALSVSIRQET